MVTIWGGSMENIVIVESGNKYGNMNTSKSFYPESFTREMIEERFLQNRLELGFDYGFDGRKMFMADQKHQSGSYFEITRDYVLANPNGWSNILEDILLITDKVPEVVIGHAVADCPVVIMADERQKVMGVAHCSAALIDKKMPMMLADALVDAYASRDDDLRVYVGACAADSWTYDRYPSWATDEKMWERGIYFGDDGLFHIDMRKVLSYQFLMRNISLGKIIYNMDDTITNPNYYSNSMASKQLVKRGRHFTGAFYKK